MEREYYEEGIYVGYRYFDTFGIPVRYEFGFGLSYTEFALSDCTVKKEQNGMLEITAKVKNTGDRTGKEGGLCFPSGWKNGKRSKKTDWIYKNDRIKTTGRADSENTDSMEKFCIIR